MGSARQCRRHIGWRGAGAVTVSDITVAAIHFDLDGVLADSAASVSRAWRAWAERHAVPWATLEPHIEGRKAADTIAAVLPGLGHSERQAEAELVNAYQVADEADATP